MIENRWGGATAPGRARERDDLWPPYESDFDDADAQDWHGAEVRDEGQGDASAFLTGSGWEEPGSERPGVVERASGALGALTALALVAGLGAWTWDLAVRDLSGVPVVRALEGPARVAPDEPGGDVAEHQGLAVNAIQAARDEEPVPERVLLAPGAQVLASDDVAPEVAAEEAGTEVAEAPAARAARIGPRPDAAVLMLASAEVGDAATSSWGGARIDSQPADDPIRAALAEALGEPAPEADDPTAAGARTPLPDAEVTEVVAVIAPGGSVERSPRPSSRPEAAAPVAAAPDAAPDAPPRAVAAGTWLVQLGAYPAEDAARAEWARLAEAQGAYLSDLAPVVTAATSGRQAFWRLRAAGFAEGADARRLCSALVAEGLDCVPVMVR